MEDNKDRLQAIFDKCVRHLLTQGERCGARSAEGEFLCLYRSPAGLRCAVGGLITDEAFASYQDGKDLLDPQSMNRYGVHMPDVVSALRDSGIDASRSDSQFLLGDLQTIHDQMDPSFWREALKHKGHERGMDLDVFLEFPEL